MFYVSNKGPSKEDIEWLIEQDKKARSIIEWAIMFKKAQLVIFFGSIILLLTGNDRVGKAGIVYSFVLWLIATGLVMFASRQLARAVRKMLDQ